MQSILDYLSFILPDEAEFLLNITLRVFLLPPLSQGEEGGGEGTLFVEMCLVVEIADRALHTRFEGAHRCLCASNHIAQI